MGSHLVPVNPVQLFKQDDLDVIRKGLENPVEVQKDLASKLSIVLNKMIDDDIRLNGYVRINTRTFIDTFNNMLDGIHKKLYGDKSVQLNIHKVTHSDIASMMRKYSAEEQDNNIMDAEFEDSFDTAENIGISDEKNGKKEKIGIKIIEDDSDESTFDNSRNGREYKKEV